MEKVEVLIKEVVSQVLTSEDHLVYPTGYIILFSVQHLSKTRVH